MADLGFSGDDGAVDADVAVVGYGPVGMVMAALLARHGRRVVVLERHSGLYNLPRAGVFDDETMRTWARLGIAEGLLPKLKSPDRYDFRNGAELGIALGRIQTERDPVRAAERDRTLLARRAANQPSPKINLPSPTVGLLARCSALGRGALSVQGFVDAGSGRSRFDSVVGPGFCLLVNAELLPELEHSGSAAALRDAGVTVVGLATEAGTDGTLVDVDGTYRQWFAERGWVAVAVRPDFNVYGTALDLDSARALASELLSAFGTEMAGAAKMSRPHGLGT